MWMQWICNEYAMEMQSLASETQKDVMTCARTKRLSSQSSEVTLVNTMEDVGKPNTLSAKPNTCAVQCPSIYLFDNLWGGSYDKD